MKIPFTQDPAVDAHSTAVDAHSTAGVSEPAGSAPPGTPALSFGCDDCSLQHSDHCGDCVVTYLCAADDGSVVVTMDELRLVRRLQSGGLAPPLRYSRRGSATA